MPFSRWLANLLGQSESDVKRILEDENALHFLIAWSLFEAKCFSGYMRSSKIDEYSNIITNQDLVDSEFLIEVASYFHERYQDKKRLKSLFDRDKTSLNQLKPILAKNFDEIEKRDRIFLVVLVIYRFRNNMFHGNKTVQTWLQFSKPILYCIQAMQLLVSHAETKVPTMTEASN